MTRAHGDPGSPGGSEEFDGAAEVVAVARTQRRIAIGYGLVFVMVNLSVPVLSLVLPWWSTSRLLGGMSPSFVVVAGGLYVFFLTLGLAAATLARSVEDRMLGTASGDADEEPSG